MFGALVLCLVFTPQFHPSFAQSHGQNEGARSVASKVIPAYPQLARSIRLEGTVKLEVVVLANGMVKSIQVKGGSPLLVQSAQDAVHEWKWEKADHETTELVQFHFTPN
jgi:TonB family protein